ncbi:MAG TPA: prepilin-type N-terminal cleavage/methylation domain-containing protein [Longimicrobium sp.]
MATERAPRADAGFTLIEVLIAMIILAVGLLALESLGIGAAASVRRADVQSRYAALATNELETALNEIQRTPAVAQNSSFTTTDGVRVFRTVTSSAVAGTTYNLYSISVRVLPPTSNRGAVLTSDSVNMTSNVVR